MNIKCISYGLFYSKTFDNVCLKYFLLNLIPLEDWVRIVLKGLRNDGNALTGLKILQIFLFYPNAVRASKRRIDGSCNTHKN